MSQKSGLSIRYKILLLMTLLPLVILAVYLFMAVRVFEEDKIAYVYESSSSVARSLAAQTTTELESVRITARPALQEVILHEKFGEVSKGVIATESPLQWVVAFHAADSTFPVQLDVLEREGAHFQTDWSQMAQSAQWLTELEQGGHLIRAPFHDDRVLIGEKLSFEQTSDHPAMTYLFMMLAKVPSVAGAFADPGQTQNFLVDVKGQILFGPLGKAGDTIQKEAPVNFLKTANQFAQGTEEVDGPGGQPMLVSYSRTSDSLLYAVSLTPKKAALKAVSTLLRKSLIFFIVLICVTVVVSLLASSGLTASLTELFLATKKVGEGHFDIRVPVNSHDEVGSLATSFNAMAEEVSRLMLETAEKARMEGELKTAQTVQETLFPAPNAEIQGLRVSGFYEPASECGGDWWHYCEIKGKIYVWIGDATGHGAPAALITSAAKSAATVIESLNVGPSQALELLNRAVYEVSKGRIMMTFFLGCYDPKERTFSYSNASHESPFLIQKIDRPFLKKDLIPLNEVNSPRLGQAVNTKFAETSIQLNPGDRILFYTDGIPDIQSPQNVAWGEREFIKGILASNQNYPSAETAVTDLVSRFQKYRQGADLIDDITFFIIQVAEPSV